MAEDLKPEVTHAFALSMQVCVPAEWDDEQVRRFAEAEYLCGTTGGWQIRRDGDALLAGCLERTPCLERAGAVHIILDA